MGQTLFTGISRVYCTITSVIAFPGVEIDQVSKGTGYTGASVVGGRGVMGWVGRVHGGLCYKLG